MIYDQNEPRREQRESDCRQVLTEYGTPETAGRLVHASGYYRRTIWREDLGAVGVSVGVMTLWHN